MSLSPDSPEDESGIKKAAENSELNVSEYHRRDIHMRSVMFHNDRCINQFDDEDISFYVWISDVEA